MTPIMVTTTIMTPNQMMFFFFKQKTAYEITASDWSSDVCSSDLPEPRSIGLYTRGKQLILGNILLAGHLAEAPGVSADRKSVV